MDAKGGLQDVASDGQVLHWTGRVVCAEDLRRSLNGHRELVLAPRAIVTPLAHEELRSRGVTITRQTAPQAKTATTWGYAQDRPEPLVQSLIRSLERDGVALKELAAPPDASACRWAAAVAKCVTDGKCTAGVVFCQDAGLLCCVANKFSGLRAVAVAAMAGFRRPAFVCVRHHVQSDMCECATARVVTAGSRRRSRPERSHRGQPFPMLILFDDDPAR